MFLLIDCNNFFVSCEQLFRPDLVGKPVAVLSSNDGCVVARSNEVKALGVPMGVPVFQVRELLRQNAVTLFSSNFALYSDISNRIMKTLMHYCDTIDVYSIDEAFLSFPVDARDTSDAWEEYAHIIRADILQSIGVPVSIGIATSKTLAKVASQLAKKGNGVMSLLDTAKRTHALESVPIGDVWNIGRAYTSRLVAQNITTAGSFCALPTLWVKQHMGVMGLRTYYELNGMSCFGEVGVPSEKKSMISSRSFGAPTTSYHDIYQAIARHVADVACSARTQGSCVSRLSIVLIRRAPGSGMRDSTTRECDVVPATDDTRVLLKVAHRLLEESYCSSGRYIKVGVLVSGLLPRALANQPTLFLQNPEPTRDDMRDLFACVDRLNTRYGKGSVRLAAEPGPGMLTTKVKTDHISPAYTTSWNDIVRVK